MNPNQPNDVNETNWSCMTCTFLNSSLLPHCEACMTPKPCDDGVQFKTNDNNEHKNNIPTDSSNHDNSSVSNVDTNENDNHSSGSQSAASNSADNNNNNTGSGDVGSDNKNDNIDVSGGQSINNNNNEPKLDTSSFNIDDNTQNQQNPQNPQNNNSDNNDCDGYTDNVNNGDNDYTSSSTTFSSSDESILDDAKSDDDDRERQQEIMRVPATYSNDQIRTLYQIYYKAKGTKPLRPDHLLKYGKTVNIHAKWGEVNKFIKKNSSDYLDSLITPQALQYVSVPQMDEETTITIKVEREDSEYYLVKGLTEDSSIHDICNKLEPRLNVISAEINLYRNHQQLARFQAIKQLGLKDGDTVSMEVHTY